MCCTNPGPGVQRYPLMCSYHSYEQAPYWHCVKPATGRNAKHALVCEEHGADPNVVQVLDARVSWSDGWANSAHLEILINRSPDRSAFRYEQHGSLYIAEHQGIASFFAYEAPDEGYGGAHFPITMVDGSARTLIGPWSSGAYAVNAAGHGPVLDVSFADKPEDFARGYTFFSGHITLELAVAKVLPLIQGVSLLWVESTLVPVKVGSRLGVIGTPPIPTQYGPFSPLSASQSLIVNS